MPQGRQSEEKDPTLHTRGGEVEGELKKKKKEDAEEEPRKGRSNDLAQRTCSVDRASGRSGWLCSTRST
jgi:hypothetical protein